MKFNFVKTIVSFGISVLIAFWFYSFTGNQNKVLIGAGSFISILITLLFCIGINFSLPRTTTMVRTVSAIFFGVAIISNLIFTFYPFSIPIYIIINGILMLAYTLVAYSVYNAQQ